MPRLSMFAVILVVGATAYAVSSAAPATQLADDSLHVVRLRCAYRNNPLGIDVTEPRLSWVVRSSRRGAKQTAYRILAASSRAILDEDRGDLWDTGKVASDRTYHVTYQGTPLQTRQRVWWKVRAWDEADRPSAFSEPAWWEMALFGENAWQGRWIGASPDAADVPPEPKPAPLFRRVFQVAGAVQTARVYICGLGYYELYLNGSKVGDRVLDPAFTDYTRRTLYAVHDVTDMLTSGGNAIGVMLGNGWFNMHTRAVWDFDKAPWRASPRVIAQLEIEYEDGRREIIPTGPQWKVTSGPIVFDAIRNGEVYDARLELDGWASTACDDADWRSAVLVDPPRGRLVAQPLPPIRVTKTIAPVQLTEPKPGSYVFDLGQNIAGWARIRVQGPAGTRVTLKYGERLNPQGLVDQQAIKAHSRQDPFQTDTYILRGRDEEVYAPRFVYHGFRYVEVRGLASKPSLDTLEGCVVHTDFPSIGRFTCSNELLNRIHECMRWAYVGNFHGYPTDCPHREKNGWTGDAHMASEWAMFNVDNVAGYAKWIDDMRDAMRPDGSLPGIVPTSGWGYHWGNGPAWDSAYLIIPWRLYLYHGDRGILARHYDHFKRYVDYLGTRAENHIVSFGLGDWLPLEQKTPEALTSTAYYYLDASILARVAHVLGRDDDARIYLDLADRIRAAFNATFYDPGTGRYATGSQTAQACAVHFGLVPPGEEDNVVAVLVENLAACDGHINSGVLGSIYIPRALTKHGRVDRVYDMVTKTTFPGWGHWMAQGATTLWEDWPGEGSRNHAFFGDIGAWFFQALAGIRVDPDRPAFANVIIAPHVVGDLSFVDARVDTIRGRVRSAWRRDEAGFTLDVTIPANATARVRVPCSDAGLVREGGLMAAEAPGVTLRQVTPKACYYTITSGTYRFTCPQAPLGEPGEPATRPGP